MRIVVALGGNALLRRGQPMTAENQRENVRIAARQLAPIAEQHELVVSHGNGAMRQVSRLAAVGDVRAMHAEVVERTRRSAEEALEIWAAAA